MMAIEKLTICKDFFRVGRDLFSFFSILELVILKISAIASIRPK